MYCRTLLTRIACERSVKQRRSSVLSPAQLMASTSCTSERVFQLSPISLALLAHQLQESSNSFTGPRKAATMAITPAMAARISLVLWKRTITRTNEAFSRPTFATSSFHSFWSLQIPKESQSEPSTGGFPPPTAATRQMCVKRDEEHQDEVRPRCVDVRFIKRRKSETVPVQSPPERGPHHGRYPGKGGEGQEACIVHRVGPTGGNNTASTPETRKLYAD